MLNKFLTTIKFLIKLKAQEVVQNSAQKTVTTGLR